MDQEIIERIKQTLADHRILLFMKGTPDFPMCGFSAQSVAALRALDAKFDHINILEDQELREALKTYSSWPTFPQLYVDGELIGGCDITIEMYNNGELKQVVDKVAAD